MIPYRTFTIIIGIDLFYILFVIFLCCYFYSLSEDEAKEVFKSLRQAAGIFMQAKVIFFVLIFYGCGFIGNCITEKVILIKIVKPFLNAFPTTIP